MNPENIVVSSLEDMEKRNLSSIIFKLESLFPDKTETIEKSSESFIRACHQEILAANQDLPDYNLVSLNEKELQAIELFYQLKAEKQLRDSFSVSIKNTVYQFLENNIVFRNKKKEQPVFAMSEMGEPDYQPSAEEARELAEEVLASFSMDELTKDDQTQLKTHFEENGGRSLQSIPLDSLVEMVQKNAAMTERFAVSFQNDVFKRELYSKRQIRESVAMLSALFSELKEDEKVLDLCTGTGVISTVVKNLGYDVKGVDLNDEALRVGNVYDIILSRKAKTPREEHLIKGDVLESKFPESDVWIAKHPCAPGLALPDVIIDRFAKDQRVKRLYLLTCCADKSVHCCPEVYKKAGITTDQHWDDSCSAAIDVGLGIEGEELKEIQGAFREINEVRLKYIKEVLGFEAELVEIPGTAMNQMIIVRKKP